MAESSELMLESSSVVMCKQCRTILAEGRNACDCNEMLKVIAFVSVTQQVQVDLEKLQYETVSELEGCLFHLLMCSTCTANVGYILINSGSEFAHLRQLFCFFTKSIQFYSMKGKQIYEGEWFHFDVAHCLAKLRKLEQDMYDLHTRIKDLVGRAQLQLESPLGDN